MAQLIKMRLPKKKVLKWFLDHYGIGGACNYYRDTIINTLKGIKMILEENGMIEIEYVAKFLLKLNKSNEAVEDFLNELEEWGI